MSVLFISLNNAPLKCGDEPVPGEAKPSAPGLNLARSTNSLIDLAGTAGLTTTTIGVWAMVLLRVRALCSSKDILLYWLGLCVSGLAVDINSVYASGAAFAAICARMLPFAPGRLSITTCWPRLAVSFSQARAPEC